MNILQEALARHVHAAWSARMQNVLGKSTLYPDGSVTIPAVLAREWTWKSNTLYKNLPEREKEEARAEADKIISLMSSHEWFKKEES